MVATGIRSPSANRRSAAPAPARVAPWPASTTGARAARSRAAARSIWPGDGSSGRGTFTGSGPSPSGAGASSTSSGTARYTDPGRSLWASLNALRIISGAAPGVATSAAHLLTAANIGTRSTP